MWFNTVFEQTFKRTQDGGNKKAGLAAQFSAAALQEAFAVQQIELPMIMYSYQMASMVDLNATDCYSVYSKSFGWPAAAATALCDEKNPNMTTFNFKDKLATARALMTMHLYNDTYKPEYVKEFMMLSNLTTAQFNANVPSETSPFGKFIVASVFTPIYTYYKSTLCTNPGATACSDKELS